MRKNFWKWLWLRRKKRGSTPTFPHHHSERWGGRVKGGKGEGEGEGGRKGRGLKKGREGKGGVGGGVLGGCGRED